MNRRGINTVLTRKHNNWIDSIKNDEVAKLAKKNSIITGGAIASMLLGEKPTDFDIYFTNLETTKAVAQYYVDHWSSESTASPSIVVDECRAGAEEDRVRILIPSEGIAFNQKKRKKEYFPIFLTDNAITLSNKVQLVIRFFGNADRIHKNYDFVHCTNYWASNDGRCVLRADAMESLLSKHLSYIGSKYPLCSMIRVRKFLKRGWHINAGQMLKIMMQISELNLLDVNVLKEQLVGVDTAYFEMLIKALTRKQEKDSNFKINSSYIAQLIDRIFE